MKCPHCGKEIESTAKRAIKKYYRSRAAGSKVTLRQIAQEFGLNYKYLSTVKSAHDKALS